MNGPAAALDALTGLKVQIVEFENLAAPAGGGSALRAEAADMDSIVIEAGDFAGVGLLRGWFDVAASPFEQQDGLAVLQELNGEGDPGGTGAYDADVGVLRLGRSSVDEVANHWVCWVEPCRLMGRITHATRRNRRAGFKARTDSDRFVGETDTMER